MALRFFLAIPGIPGGSTVARYRDTIELTSYSLGASNTGMSTGFPFSGVGAASFRPQLTPLKVTKFLDESTIPLLNTLLSGRVLPSMTLFVTRQAGEDGLREVLRITFNEVRVTDFNQAAEEEDILPVEKLQFTFAQVTFQSNAFGFPQSVTYDTRTNRVT